jgi:predicted Zn-dependent protease
LVQAFSGDLVKAEATLETLKREMERTDKTRMLDYWFMKGLVEARKGNYGPAVEALLRTKPQAGFPANCELGVAYFKAGSPVDAVNELEKALRGYSEDRAVYPYGIRAHYYLARAHEELGHTDDAVAEYEEFLAFWGKGDPVTEEIADAEARLAALRQPG